MILCFNISLIGILHFMAHVSQSVCVQIYFIYKLNVNLL